MALDRSLELAALSKPPVLDQGLVMCTCSQVTSHFGTEQYYVAARSVAAELNNREHGPAHFRTQVNELLGRTRVCCLAFEASLVSFAHHRVLVSDASTAPIRPTSRAWHR